MADVEFQKGTLYFFSAPGMNEDGVVRELLRKYGERVDGIATYDNVSHFCKMHGIERDGIREIKNDGKAKIISLKTGPLETGEILTVQPPLHRILYNEVPLVATPFIEPPNMGHNGNRIAVSLDIGARQHNLVQIIGQRRLRAQETDLAVIYPYIDKTIEEPYLTAIRAMCEPLSAQ